MTNFLFFSSHNITLRFCAPMLVCDAKKKRQQALNVSLRERVRIEVSIYKTSHFNRNAILRGQSGSQAQNVERFLS